MKNKKAWFVYKVTNLINGKIYVGQRRHPRGNRLNPQPSYLGSGTKIKKAVDELGKENFKRVILCWCFDREIADEMEIYYIKKFDSKNPDIGYNIVAGGQLKMPEELISLYGEDNPNYGNKWTDEQKKKMSEFAKSRNLYGENNPNYGNRWSEEKKLELSRKVKESGKSNMSNNPRAVKIQCVEDGTIYGCMKELSIEINWRPSRVMDYIRKNKSIEGKTYIKLNNNSPS